MMNQMPNQPMNQMPSPEQLALEKALMKCRVARSNLLLLIAFTALNIVLSAITTAMDPSGGGVYLLFSATVPYLVSQIGFLLYAETAKLLLLIAFVLVGVLLTVPYLVCWKFSDKHYGWMIGALVYFALDCVFLLFFFDTGLILDIIMHAWVMYYLIIGVKYGKQLDDMKKAMQQNKQNTEDQQNRQ